MKVEELLAYGNRFLHKDKARLLLSSLLGYNPLEILNYLSKEVDDKIVKKYYQSIDALLTNKPIQYVLGNVNFYGYSFKVTKSVLIPRFETEELVEATLHYIEEYFDEPIKVLDLGCGSGVIGITLKKKMPNLDVTLVDISKEALDVASDNATNLEAQVNFLESDMLDNVTGRYSVVISNPPYIKEDEKIEDIVRDNEPHLALYAGKDGLDCYRKILKNVKDYLTDKFLLAFEIGATQKEDVLELIHNYLDDVEVITKKDLQGRNRMIFVFHNLV